MERYAEKSLAWYAARARSIDAKRRPPFFESETGEVVQTLTAEEEEMIRKFGGKARR
jgi:hypothetical protein